MSYSSVSLSSPSHQKLIWTLHLQSQRSTSLLPDVLLTFRRHGVPRAVLIAASRGDPADVAFKTPLRHLPMMVHGHGWMDSRRCARARQCWALVSCNLQYLQHRGVDDFNNTAELEKTTYLATFWVAPCGWEFNRGRGRSWESRPLSRFCFAFVFKRF